MYMVDASDAGRLGSGSMLVDAVQPQIMEAIVIMYRERHMQQPTVCTRRKLERFAPHSRAPSRWARCQRAMIPDPGQGCSQLLAALRRAVARTSG